MGYRFLSRALSLTLVAMLLASDLVIIATFQPVLASPGLTLKWRKSLGSRGWTHIGPLAADLLGNSRLEIVLTGGDNKGTGAVTALNSTTGDILWQYSYSQVGTHSPFEIADLNKDNVPEIVVSAWFPLVLHNDGSLYWMNQNAKAFQNFNTNCDIDGDGYPEIFICSGSGPDAGYDYITRMSYDGNIEAQAWCWHPCYGGVTIGDTNFDGRFELYQGDRSTSYSNSPDAYKGGGMGINCRDPYTLEVLWNDPTILCSSQSPTLADVNKDGILDVIVAMQTNAGIAVLNSSDGSVITTGGKYRKGPIVSGAHAAHSQPTTADIDGDGNLEFITCDYSQPRIWDLYDWKLDATLPITCNEPPKVGDVTGDGKLDIVAMNYTGIYIYSYNSVTKVYDQVDSVTGLGGSEPNAFTLIQDLDGDGLNELVVTSMKGDVYCYGTSGLAPTPRVRSNVQFYSERRCGAAEYVPPFTQFRPSLTEETPAHGLMNQILNPTLSVNASNYQGNPMTVTFSTNASGSWLNIATYTGGNGVYTASPTTMNSYGRTYYWSVRATGIASGNWTQEVYEFTTLSRAPTQIDPNLQSSGGTNGSKEDLICSNQTTSDPDGDKVTNVYSWQVNGTPFANMILPFDSLTSSSVYVLFDDGFEQDFNKWNENGVTDWDRTTGQSHSGSYSANAGSASNYLTSDDLDTSTASSIYLSFWYMDNGVDPNDNVYVQFWDGSTYQNIFKLDSSVPENTWHQYSMWWRTLFRYSVPGFNIRFSASSIDTGEDLWIDDVTVKVKDERAKDYSTYGNNGEVQGASWTRNGIVGGAYTFDGNDFMKVDETGGSLGGDGTWTEISLEFWVRATTTGSTERLMWKHAVNNETIIGYRVDFRARSSRNELTWLLNTPLGSYSVQYYVTTNLADWHHVVCTYKSGQGLRIYVDGGLKASTWAMGYINNTLGGPLEIAHETGSDFIGMLDEVKIYPRALSPNQVLASYLDSTDGKSDHSTISWPETSVGDIWRCQVTPNDGFGDGVTKFSNSLTIVPSPNNSPSASSLTLNPTSPRTTDTLTGSYSYFDQNGDPEWGSEIRWYKNGQLQPELNSSLIVPPSFTTKGEAWYFTVRPKDGDLFGNLATSPTVTILNGLPSFAGVYITPDPAFSTSTLKANTFGWSDPDGDTEGYAYQWQKRVSGTWVNITGATSPTLGSGNFAAGDYIRVSCTPFDGQDYGTSRVKTIWIATFQPPLSNPLLISSLGTNTTSEDLICYNQTATPPQTTNIYNWYRNDVSLANLLMPFDTNSPTTAKDYSGYGNNGAITSATWSAASGIKGTGAYTFDGSNDIITVPDAASLGGDGTWSEITVEFWIKLAGSQYGKRIIGKMFPDATEGAYTVGLQTDANNQNALFWYITTPSGSGDTSDTALVFLNVGDWYHITCTYKSGSGMAIYINGTLRLQQALSGNIAAQIGSALYIGGALPTATNRYFNGTLDQIRIYPKALSASQIVQLYIEGREKSITSSTIAQAEVSAGNWKCNVTPIIGSNEGTSKYSNTLTVGVPPYVVHLESRQNTSSSITNVGTMTFDGQSYSLPSDVPRFAGGYSATYTPVSGYIFDQWETTSGVSVSNAGINPTTVTVSGSGTLRAVYKVVPPTTYVVHLESRQNTSSSITNVGTMTFDGQSYSLPSDVPRFAGGYSATYTPVSGYIFDQWETDGLISVSNAFVNPTSVTVSGDGTLRAVYKIPPSSHYIFADGFESGSFNAWTGTTASSGETFSVVDSLAYRGSHSALFTSNGDAAAEGVYSYITISSSTELYARGYFRVSQSGLADNDDRFYFIRFMSGSTSIAYAGWRRVGGSVRWNLLLRDGTTLVSVVNSSSSPSLDQWYCVELHWVGSSTNGYGELYVDGVLVCSLTGRNTNNPGNVSQVRFGLAEMRNCAATTAYADCCVVDQSYIGPEP